MAGPIVYWNNVPPPYMIIRWSALAEELGEDRFEVWLNRTKMESYGWASRNGFNHRVRVNRTLRVGRFTLTLPSYVLGRRPAAVVALYEDYTFVVGLIVLFLRKVPVYLWCEATTERHKPGRRGRRVKNLVRRALFARATGFFSPGPDADRYIVRNGGKPERTYRLPHVVDQKLVGRVHDRSNATNSGAKAFAYVGRLIPGKGLETLLRAFSSGAAFSSLRIIGDGPERAELEEYASELGVADRVTFAGFLQPDAVGVALARIDVLVVPSEAETYALVVDEALASGAYVLASSGISEIRHRISSERIGRVFEVDNAPELASIMSKLESSGIPGTAEERMRVVQWWTPKAWSEILRGTLEENGSVSE